MIGRRLQFFSVALLLASVAAAHSDELRPGNIYRLTFQDVDGNTHSTSNGHVTIITVTTRQTEKRAREVAELMPDRCLGDPKFRYLTFVNFQRKLGRAFQGMTKAIIRRRLDAEGKRLKAKYEAKKIARDARKDIFVVPDFDGAAVTQLGLSPDSGQAAVFVFNGEGRLVNRWTGVPPGDSLAKAITAAE